jgi:hypothetical protein
VLRQRDPGVNQLVICYLLLRKIVGWIGMLLPFVLLIGNAIEGASRPDSMSGYYYTPMRNIFVGALCALGVFLIAYDGYDGMDKWITNIAGFGAIGVAFCPTKPSGPVSAAQNVAGDCHVVFAVGTFTALGLMALRFAKGEQARLETVGYYVCGSVIFACVLLAVASNFLPSAVNANWPVLFILEATAVVAFGVSWFVKGGTILRCKVHRGEPRPGGSYLAHTPSKVAAH